MLGGEHCLTTGLVKAYKNKFPNMSVLQIDAHSDLRDGYSEAREDLSAGDPAAGSKDFARP